MISVWMPDWDKNMGPSLLFLYLNSPNIPPPHTHTLSDPEFRPRHRAYWYLWRHFGVACITVLGPSDVPPPHFVTFLRRCLRTTYVISKRLTSRPMFLPTRQGRYFMYDLRNQQTLDVTSHSLLAPRGRFVGWLATSSGPTLDLTQGSSVSRNNLRHKR